MAGAGREDLVMEVWVYGPRPVEAEGQSSWDRGGDGKEKRHMVGGAPGQAR